MVVEQLAVQNEDFINHINKTVAEVKRLAFDHSGWKLKKRTPEVDIYSTTVPGCAWPCFKGESTIHMPAERILDTVHPTYVYRSQFDFNFARAYVVHQVSDNTAIIRQTFKPSLFGVLSQRDSIDIFQFYKTPDYHYSIFSSVKHPAYPPTSECVRGWAYPMGLIAIPTNDPNTSKVIAISQMDFKLPPLIPRSIVETVIPSQYVQYFSCLKKMEFQPYERLGPDTPLCQWRKYTT